MQWARSFFHLAQSACVPIHRQTRRDRDSQPQIVLILEEKPYNLLYGVGPRKVTHHSRTESCMNRPLDPPSALPLHEPVPCRLGCTVAVGWRDRRKARYWAGVPGVPRRRKVRTTQRWTNLVRHDAVHGDLKPPTTRIIPFSSNHTDHSTIRQGGEATLQYEANTSWPVLKRCFLSTSMALVGIMLSMSGMPHCILYGWRKACQICVL